MIALPWRGRFRSVFAVAVSAIFAAPLYIALVNVFKPADTIRAHPLALPISNFTTANIVSAAKLSLVQTGLKTSLIITVGTLIVMVPLSAMVAYYISLNPSFAFGGQPINPLPVGIAIRKHDQLRPAVQAAVQAQTRASI